jgi:hypothetical protein
MRVRGNIGQQGKNATPESSTARLALMRKWHRDDGIGCVSTKTLLYYSTR